MRYTGKLFWGALFGLLLLSAPVGAGSIQVKDAWALHADQGEVTGIAVFMTITNYGTTRDRLYAAKSKVAGSAELSAERHSDHGALAAADGGNTHATAVALEVKPGQSLALRHDGNHIMLHGIKSEVRAGDSFYLTLFFEEAGPIKVEVAVKDDGH
jgi:copper(I)-binding protein